MRNYSRAIILKLAVVGIASSALVVIPTAPVVSEPSVLLGLFSPEPLPPEFAARKYRAFRAVLPDMVIMGQFRSITLTPAGKLSVVVDDQAKFIPKKGAADQSESHMWLVPGGFISPELIAKP